MTHGKLKRLALVTGMVLGGFLSACDDSESNQATCYLLLTNTAHGHCNTVTVIPGECPPCGPEVEDCDPWDDPCDPTVEDCGRDTDEPDTDGPVTEDRHTDMR
jgi:hypothetical protein